MEKSQSISQKETPVISAEVELSTFSIQFWCLSYTNIRNFTRM